jgi:hypothetical protein
MFLLAHTWLRGLVLACMVLLSGTASYSCDSYDPDPYDNTPPVVTVEFNFVVPGRVNIRRPQNQNKRPFRIDSGNILRQLPYAEVSRLYEPLVVSPLPHGSPQWVIPLRR